MISMAEFPLKICQEPAIQMDGKKLAHCLELGQFFLHES